MKPRMLALAATFALLGPHAIAHDGVRVHDTCDARVPADCPAPPVPPVPPAPPAQHSMPLPPAPPAPPPIPAVPAAAHAACTGQPAGTPLTHVLRQGATMTGVCERAGGKPVFRLREYRHDA